MKISPFLFGLFKYFTYLCIIIKSIKVMYKNLLNTDYVIYDRANDHVVKFETNGEVVIFGVKEEAITDCRGNEEVIRCTDLPKHWQDTILTQINLDN